MECPVKIEFKFNNVNLMKNILTSQEYIHKWQFAISAELVLCCLIAQMSQEINLKLFTI